MLLEFNAVLQEKVAKGQQEIAVLAKENAVLKNAAASFASKLKRAREASAIPSATPPADATSGESAAKIARRAPLTSTERGVDLFAGLVRLIPALLSASRTDGGFASWNHAEINMIHAMRSVAVPRDEQLACSALHSVDACTPENKLAAATDLVLIAGCKRGASGPGTAMCPAVIAACKVLSSMTSHCGKPCAVRIVAAVYGGNDAEIERFGANPAVGFEAYVRDIRESTSKTAAASRQVLSLPPRSTLEVIVCTENPQTNAVMISGFAENAKRRLPPRVVDAVGTVDGENVVSEGEAVAGFKPVPPTLDFANSFVTRALESVGVENSPSVTQAASNMVAAGLTQPQWGGGAASSSTQPSGLLSKIVACVLRDQASRVMGEMGLACQEFEQVRNEEDAIKDAFAAASDVGARALGAPTTEKVAASAALVEIIRGEAPRAVAHLVDAADRQSLRDELMHSDLSTKLPAALLIVLSGTRLEHVIKTVCLHDVSAGFILAYDICNADQPSKCLADVFRTKAHALALLCSLDQFLDSGAVPAHLLDRMMPLRDEVKLALRVAAVRESTLLRAKSGTNWRDTDGKRMLAQVAGIASASPTSLRLHVAKVHAVVLGMDWTIREPTEIDVYAAFEVAIAEELMPEKCASHSASASRAHARKQTSRSGNHQVAKLASSVLQQLSESGGGTDVDG